MRYRIYVHLKSGVYDPQGDAIGKVLKKMGMTTIEQIKTGKFFDVEVSEQNADQAKDIVQRAAEQLLANVVIEKYSIEGPLP